MGRVEPEALDHGDLERIFIAAKLAEAQRVEEVLTLEGVEYIVTVEPFVGGIFSTFRPRNGAVFYVASTQADYSRGKLIAAGLGRGVVAEET